MLRFFIFILLISIPGVFLFVGNSRKTGRALYISAAFLLFLAVMTLRAVWVGIDTGTYVIMLRYAGQISYEGYMESGFIWFIKMLAYASQNPQWLFFVTGVIILFPVFRLIYKYSAMPLVSVLLYACDIFSFHITGMRQSLAMAFLIFSFDFIVKKKLLPFLILVFTASLFHKSAVIFAAAYPLSFVEINKKNIAAALVAAILCLAFFSIFSAGLFYVLPSYEVYTESVWYGNETKIASIVQFSIALAVFAGSYFLYNKRKTAFDGKARREFNALLWISLMSACVFLISFKATLFSRAALYFSVFNIALLPNAVNLAGGKAKMFLMVIVIIFFFIYGSIVLYYRPDWSGAIPYNFFWENRG